MKKLSIPFLVLFLMAPLVSVAEIYQCRNASGGLEFKDRPCLEQAYTGATEAHNLWREIGEISRIGESMTILRGASPDLRKQCRAKAAELTERLEGMKERVEKLEPKYNMIVEAFNDMPQCVSCGQSATYYCRESDKHLKTAANELHYRR